MAEVSCPQCGKKVDPSEGYCPFCGYTFEEEEISSPFAAAPAKTQSEGAGQSDDPGSSRSTVIGGAYDSGITQKPARTSLGDKALLFNFGYIGFAVICAILTLVPYAILTDSDKTKYSIMSSSWGTGITIMALAALSIFFTFFKRKRVGILVTAIGFGAHAIFAFTAIPRIEPTLKQAAKLLQSLEGLKSLIGEKAAKVTYTITPAYTLFAICAVIAAVLGIITFITSEDDD